MDKSTHEQTPHVISVGETKTYMNVKELAGYLGVSKWTVYDLVKERSIPFAYVGRLPRFHRATVDRWMEKRLVPSVA